MISRRCVGLLVGLAVAAHAHAAPRRDDEWRLVTPHGAVHVWRPARASAAGGVVVYVHGLYTDVDGAWREHRLREQFRASGRDALFIACEAPSGKEAPRWPVLAELLRAVEGGIGEPLPRGPLVVMGHSGAYRTIVGWLGDPAIVRVILVDALYAADDAYYGWLVDDSAHRMTLVARGTLERAQAFARRLADVVRLPRIPARAPRTTELARLRRARLLAIASQVEHMALVTDGRTLPVLLQMSELPPVRRR